MLTATPRQYGFDTQFGLLNIVDPERYQDFDKFLDETEFAEQAASLTKTLAAQEYVTEKEKRRLQTYFALTQNYSKSSTNQSYGDKQ